MGKEGIRYAAKVDLDKDAGTLPYLHVSVNKDLDGRLQGNHKLTHSLTQNRWHPDSKLHSYFHQGRRQLTKLESPMLRQDKEQ